MNEIFDLHHWTNWLATNFGSLFRATNSIDRPTPFGPPRVSLAGIPGPGEALTAAAAAACGPMTRPSAFPSIYEFMAVINAAGAASDLPVGRTEDVRTCGLVTRL